MRRKWQEVVYLYVYIQLYITVQQKCRERKEKWLNQQREEVEQLEHVNNRLMYKKIKEITGKRGTTRSTLIKDSGGKVLMAEKEILKWWEEYIKELFQDDRGDKSIVEEDPEVIPILREEIEKAVKGMMWRKAEEGREPEMLYLC